MRNLLLYLWQLPQNLLGLLLFLFYKPEKEMLYNGVTYHFNRKFPSGISLGKYVLLDVYPYNAATWCDAKHEYGHSCQSRRWGWLYLIVIGLPSACGNLWDRWFHKKWSYDAREKWYYDLPWEKDADKRGGVNRTKK